MSEERLKKELGIDNDAHIPADYNIPYFVHQDDMNKLDQSHKRVEIGLLLIAGALFLALVGTNVYWIWNESQYEDVVLTQETTTDGNGSVTVSGVGQGSVNNYGNESQTNDKNSPEKIR